MRRIYENRAYTDEPIRQCYWPTTTPPTTPDPSPSGELECEFAVIGAGYTGLNAALELAEAGADVVVLDAAQIGWGASGRNGGFCCEGGAKISPARMRRRYGEDDTRLFHRAQRAAIDLVSEMIETNGWDVDRHSAGETLLAHRPRDVGALQTAAQEFEAAHGLRATFIAGPELKDHGLAGPAFHAALTTPLGFALNPRKYVLALAQAAREAGARLFGNAQINTMAPDGRGWRLRTDDCLIRAKKVLVCTNGYSADTLPRWLAGCYLPVQSNILVTRPLTENDLRAQGFTSRQMCYDTRRMLHYFRLLPDNRLLFGMRGATSASAEAQDRMHRQMRRDLARMFPAWAEVEAPFFWSGLACLARNLVPFAGPLGDLPGAFGAFAYHGNGVAMGSYCGRLIANLALGRRNMRPYPRFMRAAPRRFELGRFRRALLPPLYRWYDFLDQ